MNNNKSNLTSIIKREFIRELVPTRFRMVKDFIPRYHITIFGKRIPIMFKPVIRMIPIEYQEVIIERSYNNYD